MTNREKYKEEILDIAITGRSFGVRNGKVVPCSSICCDSCALFIPYDCDKEKQAWANAEYQEPHIDWSKIKINTKCLVSDDGEKWERRYYAGLNSNGMPTFFTDGRTSWTAELNTIVECGWKYMELVDE